MEVVMSEVLGGQSTSSMFQDFNPELPLLASQAAIELDNLRLEKPRGFESLFRLANYIDDAFRGDERGAEISPVAIALATRAVDSLPDSEAISDYTGLVTGMRNVVKTLRSSSTAEGQPVIKARDFCIALSSVATAYLQSDYDYRPEHPYRR
jgi:hypothetical protein